MQLKQPVRRLGIFAYYDADGIVDDYVEYLVAEVGKFCTHQIFVVNGTLREEDEKKIRAVAHEILFRENSGFDITAYRDGLLSHPIDAYDEVLFYNQTIFGPVCSLDAMFREMDVRDVDFWGLSRHKGAKHASWDENESFPPHIQSYFFAVRKPMLTDERFIRYWRELPEIKSYWDAVRKHEVAFTKRFADLGFRWDVFLHTEEDEQCNDYPLMGMPREMILRGCPFVKRKVFLMDRSLFTSIPQGSAACRTWECVDRETVYPVQMIAQNITRTATVKEVTEAMSAVFEPPASGRHPESVTAVIVFSCQALADTLLEAALARPYGAVYAVFPSEELRERYAPRLTGAVCLVRQAHGAQVLFEELFEEIKTEYVLFLNGELPLLLGEFRDATSEQTAAAALTRGCEDILAQNPCFGALFALTPSHQECMSIGLEWKETAPVLLSRLKSAGICVPLGETDRGLAVRGGMFFARTKALQPLRGFSFTAADFSGAYPVWEYLVPLSVHAAGFLCGFSSDYRSLAVSYANLRSLLADVNAEWVTPNNHRADKILFRMKAIRDFYLERRYQMTLEQAFCAPLTLRQKIWICLQILLKPETFEMFRGLFGKNARQTEFPEDPLD